MTERPTPSRPLCILLVEDDEDSLFAMTRLLNLNGHRALAASSAEQALQLAASEKCDLVVSDVGLPDRSGMDLMRELSQRYGVPGIAVTGYGEEPHLTQCAAAGFHRHIKKPIEFPELLEAVNEVARRRAQGSAD